jgi:hypothetical protein
VFLSFFRNSKDACVVRAVRRAEQTQGSAKAKVISECPSCSNRALDPNKHRSERTKVTSSLRRLLPVWYRAVRKKPK